MKDPDKQDREEDKKSSTMYEDDLIHEIAISLALCDPEYICEVANKVFPDQKVSYKGDGFFKVTKN